MSYFIYRSANRRAEYPHNWQFVQKEDDYEAAKQAASRLCGTTDIDTEPSPELPQAYFGKASSDKWTAMIKTHDIHNDAR